VWIDATIESRDVRGAKRKACRACPAARCLMRHLDPQWAVFVKFINYYGGPCDIYVTHVDDINEDGDCMLDDVAAIIPAPNNLRHWIETYDNSKPGRPPKPIEFKVNIPKKYLKKEVAQCGVYEELPTT
jgi:hypothetical protein